MKNKKIVLLSSSILFAGASLTALFAVSFLHNKEASCLEMDRSLKGGATICYKLKTYETHCQSLVTPGSTCSPTAVTDIGWQKQCAKKKKRYLCDKPEKEGIYNCVHRAGGEKECPTTISAAKCVQNDAGGYVWKVFPYHYQQNGNGPVSCGEKYFDVEPQVYDTTPCKVKE